MLAKSATLLQLSRQKFWRKHTRKTKKGQPLLPLEQHTQSFTVNTVTKTDEALSTFAS